MSTRPPEPGEAPGGQAGSPAAGSDPAGPVGEDRHLRKSIGFWQLTAISFSGVIGSGWLLAALYAAQAAGPEALVTWVVGGAALLLIALVMVELGASRPESGGLVRWPFYTSGRLVATLVGWGIWIAYATNPPSESAAVLQYLSQHVSGIYSGSSLTALGILIAAGMMAVFVALNWFGVRLFANVNGAVTVAKFVVPVLTVILLFASGFHRGNYTGHGGFAPYGISAGLSAIATAGIIYAYTGFQGPIDLSGEARNPRRDVPWAVVAGLVGSTLVYLALQAVFIGVMPAHELVRGWSGINLSSPFAQLAVMVNLTWLSWVLYADAIVSPSGSALTFTATSARESYAMAKNRFLPAAAAKVDRRWGVPHRALLINFVIGLAFLLPFQSWHSIVAATSELGLFAYSITAVAQAAFRRADPGRAAGWIPGVRFLAPVSFVIATLILYWATWQELRIALPVLLIGAVVYAVQQVRSGVDGHDLRAGLWLVGYLLAVLLMSGIGSFGGTGLVPAPWDSVVIGVVGLVAFLAGVRAAEHHLARHPAPARPGRRQALSQRLPDGSELPGCQRDVVARAPVPLGCLRTGDQVRHPGGIGDPPADSRLHGGRQGGDVGADRGPLRDRGVDDRDGSRLRAQLGPRPGGRGRRARAAGLHVDRLGGRVAAGNVDPEHVVPSGDRGCWRRMRAVSVRRHLLPGRDGLRNDGVVDLVRLAVSRGGWLGSGIRRPGRCGRRGRCRRGCLRGRRSRRALGWRAAARLDVTGGRAVGCRAARLVSGRLAEASTQPGNVCRAGPARSAVAGKTGHGQAGHRSERGDGGGCDAEGQTGRTGRATGHRRGLERPVRPAAMADRVTARLTVAAAGTT